MKLYLGTHEPAWIGRSDAPLFVSLSRADRFPVKRVAKSGWALDSGGFTALHRGGWTMSPARFVDEVRRLANAAGGMEWAAPQDWMCEPSAVAATGRTVAEHQHLTVENFVTLRSIAPDINFVPVLQGWAPGEHERCIELYERAGVDLSAEPLVGVGTICRRQSTDEIYGIIRDLHASGLRLHGFGVKTGGLKRYRDMLASADSLAWSFRARKAARHGEGALGGGCTHAACNNCFVWAHEWHASLRGGL